MSKIKIVVGIIFILISKLFAQTFQFEHISISEGLSQSTVHDIHQDYRGFFWFCTDNGLNRYDGRNFQIFKAEEADPFSLSGDRILTVYEDSENILWFGTETGFNMFDQEHRKFYPYYISKESTGINSKNVVNSIAEVSSDCLFIGTADGLYKFDKKERIISSVDSVNLKFNFELVINSLSKDPFDNKILWIGTIGAGLVKYNTSSEKVVNYLFDPDISALTGVNQINKIRHYNNELMYLATEDGILIFNKSKDRVERILNFNLDRYSFGNDSMSEIIFEPNGDMWFCTAREGIIHYDSESGAYSEIRYENDPDQGLSNNRVESAYRDKTGILWFGTYSGGISKYDPTLISFSYMWGERGSPLRFTSNEIWSFAEENESIMWIGTDRGLNRLDRKKSRVKHFTSANSPLSNADVFTLAIDNKDYLWIGTRNGLNRYDLKKNEFKLYRSKPTVKGSLSDNLILKLFIDSEFNLWVGTNEGLNRYDYDTDSFIVYHHSEDDPESLSSGRIFTISEDSENYLWVGTNFGLNRFDKNTGKSKRFLHSPNDKNSISHNQIYHFYEDSNNNYWIATLGGGLNKFDKTSENFTSYREADGLPNDVIYGILEDNNGHLWLSTNYGLSNFIPETETFINYTSKNGLQSNEFNFNAFLKTENKDMFFGGVNGFNYFSPDLIEYDRNTPATYITDFKIANRKILPAEEGKLKKDISFTGRIELEHDEFPFSLGFAALNFSQSQKNQFAYLLEGFNDEWINLGNVNTLTINNLEDGRYTLFLKSSNKNNIWTEQPARLEIIVHPPLYWSSWAKVLYVCIILLTVYGVIRYEKRHADKKVAIMKRSEELKTEFLAQMSHEIRTPINTILSFASLIHDELYDKVEKETKECFAAMDRAGRRIIRTIDLILDMSQIQTKTYEPHSGIHDLGELIRPLYREYKPVAEQKSLVLNFEMQEEKFNVEVDEYTVVQIFQNLIDNAIKYTQKGNIDILIGKDDVGKIIVQVKDTGIGIAEEYLDKLFDPFSQEESGYTRSFEGNGLGLALVKNYCNLNNASISVVSKKDAGSTFTVSFHN